MGRQESESSRRSKKVAVSTFILEAVQVAGLLSVAIVAPNVIGAMDKLGILPNQRQIESINAARKRMIKQGLMWDRNGNLSLTEKGARALRKLTLSNYKRKKPRRWDGKWRVLIFDIPNRRKGLRDQIRRALISIGFECLQGSVWAYPYSCDDVITMLKADLKVGRELQYLIVDSIENDRHLREHFRL